MIKMVYSTGDLLRPQLARVPYPDCRILADVGCLVTSPQFTSPLMGTKGFALALKMSVKSTAARTIWVPI